MTQVLSIAKTEVPMPRLLPIMAFYLKLLIRFLADGARIAGDVTLKQIAVCGLMRLSVVMCIVFCGRKYKYSRQCCHSLYFSKIPYLYCKNVSIGHLATIHGCTIEQGCLIGMGAIIMDDSCYWR